MHNNHVDVCSLCIFLMLGSSPTLLKEVDGVWTGDVIAHHRPEFHIDEASLSIGASIWIQLAEDLMGVNM